MTQSIVTEPFAEWPTGSLLAADSREASAGRGTASLRALCFVFLLCVAASQVGCSYGLANPPPPAPAQPGSFGYAAEVGLNGLSDNAIRGFADGWASDIYNGTPWARGFEKAYSSTVSDVFSHSWTDVFEVDTHGDIGQLNLYDNNGNLIVWDVQNQGQPGNPTQVGDARWLYVAGCNFMHWVSTDPSGDPQAYPYFANMFGGHLHGLYGYAAPFYDDQSVYPWFFQIAQDSWAAGSTSPPTTYDGYTNASDDNFEPDWSVVDGNDTHGDAASKAPNANVWNSDTNIGPLYQYWGGYPPSPFLSPNPISSYAAGSAAQPATLQPESINASYWINKYSDGTQTVYNLPGQTLVTSQTGAAILYQNSGGVQFQSSTTDETVAFDEATAQSTATAFVQNNGGMPQDAVLRLVATTGYAALHPVGGPAPRTVVGYRFFYTHAAPVSGYDGIIVSVIETGFEKCVSGHWQWIYPDPPQHKYQVWVCDQYQFQSQPAVNNYYRLWRALQLGSESPTPNFIATVSPAAVLSHIDGTHSVTRQGFAYWTPPMQWNTQAAQVATPSQYFDVDTNLRVDFDLSGNALGQSGIQ